MQTEQLPVLTIFGSFDPLLYAVLNRPRCGTAREGLLRGSVLNTLKAEHRSLSEIVHSDLCFCQESGNDANE